MSRLRQIGLRVVLVHHGDVVEDVLPLLHHLACAMVDDDGELAGECRIVRAAVGNGGRHDVARAVLMLQSFPAKRGATGSRAEQKAAGALIGRGPDEIADALKAKHRIEDIERQQRQIVHAVRGGRGHPGGQCACLGNALFQQLPVTLLAIDQQCILIFGRIELALRGIDTDLAEQSAPCRRCAPHRRRSGRCADPSVLSFSSALKSRTTAMVVDISLPSACRANCA